MPTTPTSGPTPDAPHDVPPGEHAVDRALLADLHDHLVRLTRSRRSGRDLLLRALASGPSPAPSARRVALFEASVGPAIRELSATGRPRHVDPDDLRRALAHDAPSGTATPTSLRAWEAATTLDPVDAAVVDLHLRHGLSDQEVGQVLGLDQATADATVGQALARANAAMRTHMVVRAATGRCGGLRDVVLALPTNPTGAELRAATEAHLDACSTCRAIEQTLADPFEAYRRLAPLPLPDDLARDAAEAAIAGSARGTRRAGRRSAALVAAVAAGILAVVALAGSVGGDEPDPNPTPVEQARTDVSAPRVQIVEPEDDGVLLASQRDDLGWYAEVELGAEPDDAPGWSWRWMSDHQAGTLLNQAHGSTRLYALECGRVDHDITASVVDAEGHVAVDDIHVVVEHPC